MYTNSIVSDEKKLSKNVKYRQKENNENRTLVLKAISPTGK